MKHQILTETKFFKLLDGMDNIDPTQLQVEYHIFIGRVIDLSRQAHEQHEAAQIHHGRRNQKPNCSIIHCCIWVLSIFPACM